MEDPKEARGDAFPSRIGAYRILSRVASGGMGSVYLAALDRPDGSTLQVALKVLHNHLAQEDDVAQRFVDEGRVGSRIAHPNVVAVHDAGQVDGISYLALEYVHGATLSSLIRATVAAGELVSLSIACSVFLDLLAGLHAAHEVADDRGQSLGIVHRDVSPQNILVDLEGRAFISDFGVARVKDAMRTTRSGTLIGKPGYMAPEQLTGSAVTARTDLYASGILLWECLVGKHLFSGVDDQIQGVVQQRVQPRVRSFRQEVPQEVDDLVAQMLEHDPDKRPANAFDISTRLRQALTRAGRSEVGAWVERLAGSALQERRTPPPQAKPPSGPTPQSKPIPLVSPPSEDDDEEETEDETRVRKVTSIFPGAEIETLTDVNAQELPKLAPPQAPPRSTLPPLNPPPRGAARVLPTAPDPQEPATLVERAPPSSLRTLTPPMVSTEAVRRAMPTIVLRNDPEPQHNYVGYGIAIVLLCGIGIGAWFGLRPSDTAYADPPPALRDTALVPPTSGTPELPALLPATPSRTPPATDAGPSAGRNRRRH